MPNRWRDDCGTTDSSANRDPISTTETKTLQTALTRVSVPSINKKTGNVLKEAAREEVNKMARKAAGI